MEVSQALAEVATIAIVEYRSAVEARNIVE